MKPTRVLQATSPRGLDFESAPMRLWMKAKRHGVWDPMAFDFEQDIEHWQALDHRERQLLLHLISYFLGGEESVAVDLLPLMQVIAEEERLEEEIYLSTFLWDEARHVVFFRRFLDEVARDHSDLSRFHGPSYREFFHQALPTALRRLRRDSSPEAQAEASVTYHMIAEGVLAETGYHAFHAILARNQLMPGMQEALGCLKGDEARHLAYGVFLLSRLIAEHGESVWQRIEACRDRLLPVAVKAVEETFMDHDPMPFGLKSDRFVDITLSQFNRRFRRLEIARRQAL